MQALRSYSRAVSFSSVITCFHSAAGRIDSSELGFGERLIVRAVKAPEGDYRPWPAIRDWATGIARELLGRPA